MSLDVLTGRPATTSDVPFVVALFVQEDQSHRLSLTYPSCHTEGEFLQELELFDATVESAFRILLDSEGRSIGAFGILASPGSSGAFVVGPLLAVDSTDHLDAVALQLVEAEGRGRFRQLRLSVGAESEQLLRSLDARGWSAESDWLESRTHLGPEQA